MRANLFVGTVAVLLVAGCQSSPTDLAETGHVVLEAESPPLVRLEARVENDAGGTLIYGSARRSPPNGFAPGAHVDVAVLEPDGSLLIESTLPYSQRQSVRRRTGVARFRGRLDTTLQPGSVVRVTHHDEPHGG